MLSFLSFRAPRAPGGLAQSLQRFSSTMTGGNSYVKRLTMFKVAKEEDIQEVLKAYEVLRKNAVRVRTPSENNRRRASLAFPILDTRLIVRHNQNGKPYVVSNVSRKILNTDSPLSEGYTILSQSIFKNHDDHTFYDQECPAHKELKVGGYP